MNSKFQLILLLIISFGLVHCAHSYLKTYDSVSIGDQKDTVLEKLGSPKSTRRWKGKDEWVYHFYDGNQEHMKRIKFEYGRVVSKGDFSYQPTLEQQVMDAKSMKEYEEKAEKLQKKNLSGFKDVSGE